MKAFKIGVQLYSVRDDMAKDFEGTLQKIADMGYEYVEFAGYYGKTSEEIKAILDRCGLKCISVHQGLDFFANDADKAIAYLKGFGVKYVVVPWYDRNKLAGENWDETKALFNEISAKLKASDMQLLYHNHDFEFVRLPDGRYVHDRIMSEVEGIDPELDTCWVHYAGIDPSKKIEEFAGRVTLVHLKDFYCKTLNGGPVYALIGDDGKELSGSREERAFEFRPLGMGIQNFPEILAACEAAGSEYLIVEQDQSIGRPPMEAIAISRDYLKTLGV